jgi:undecaprenyl-diphosphatase
VWIDAILHHRSSLGSAEKLGDLRFFILDWPGGARLLTRVHLIIILAVVQGIAEFLPISSSGHLVILGAMLGELSESPTLEIILHAGTLGSILVVFWRRILSLISSDRRVIPLLIVGTIPAALAGVTIKLFFPYLIRSPVLAGIMLLVTGSMLIVLGRLAPRNGIYQSLSWSGAFLVGCFQAVAILPGISRSGSTILGGRLAGLKNDDSVTFSFLLAIPAILGATVLTLRDLWESVRDGVPIAQTPAELAVGAVVSFLVGIVSLLWLIGWSRQDRLHWFAWLCIPAGLLTLTLAAAGLLGSHP